MKLIGVTPSTDENPSRIQINEDYMNAVLRAGALPVLLPLTGDEHTLDEMLRRVDGLVLTGGADVEPRCYGEERLPLCGETSPRRDEMEFLLCRKALAANLPILGICRGHEVLNCALGGTLYQDIAAQYGDALKHPCYDMPKDQVHEVRAVEGTMLHRITGLTAMRVNSRHHQAVKKAGEGLVINAYASDGLIEGTELPGRRFVLSVQWHPESLSDYRKEAQDLFDALVRACL